MTTRQFNKIYNETLTTIAIDKADFDKPLDEDEDKKWRELFSSAIFADVHLSYHNILKLFAISQTFDKIPWNENIMFYEDWAKRKEQSVFVNSHIFPHNDKKAFEIRFQANGIVDGKEGQLPTKAWHGWRFLLLFRNSEDGIVGTLSVVYKDEKKPFALTDGFVGIPLCQFALTCFLQNVFNPVRVKEFPVKIR